MKKRLAAMLLIFVMMVTVSHGTLGKVIRPDDIPRIVSIENRV